MFQDMLAMSSSGGVSETPLWTNSNPSSALNQGVLTLSDDINNYDAIKIKYKTSTSTSDEISVIYDIDSFKQTTLSSDNIGDYRIMLGVMPITNTNYVRLMAYKTDTTVDVNEAYNFSGGANNNYGIVTQILGVKF